MLLFAMFFALFSPTAKGQDICEALLCGNLSLEIVRQDANVTTSCPTSSAPCADKFRQISYKVYLKSQKYFINPSDPYPPFNLDYKLLDVKVNLNSLPALPQYSHIDVVATQNCFVNGAGAYWHNYSDPNGDKVIFDPTDKSVSISFSNLATGSPKCGNSGPGNTGNVIRFAEPQPPNADFCGVSANFKCLYVELFTVVLNAYPGEQVGFNFDVNNKYEPKSAASVCSPIPHVVGGNFNGASNIQVLNPVHYTGTANESIEVQLLQGAGTADGGYDFPVAVKNTGSNPRVVTYLEFALKATLSQLEEPFSYSLAIPREQFGGTNPQTGQTTRYLHYLITTPISLAPDQTIELSRIKMGPPVLINQGWATQLDFEGAATQPRVKTPEACTLLKTTGAPVTSSSIGDAPCNDPNIHFKVTGSSGSCGDLRANVELYTTNPPATMQLTKVEFTLAFDFDSPNISFANVEYSDWPTIACGLYGCFNPGLCYTISPDNKTFNYCFSVPSNAPTTFNLTQTDPSKNMEIIFSSTGNGCITNVAVTKLAITYVNTSAACIPRVDDPEGFSICGPMVRGMVLTETGDGVEEVTLSLDGAINNSTPNDGIQDCSNVSCSAPCVPVSDMSDDSGSYGFCQICTTCNLLKLTPDKNDNPLNGVTTYDLVLISKHILGTEPLNSPYKMIAADASKSGSVTTFDIVELRKLILGIYPVLPNNKSWRFVDKAFVFPNPNNPFQTAFPEGINCIAPPASGIDFTAVKVGDVNNTAVPNRPSERPLVNLAWPNPRTSPGGAITLPVTYTGSELMEAIQLGLRFDPSKLQLIGPSVGDIESYSIEHFNLLNASEGEIRTLWLPMTDGFEKIQPGSVLFYLSFKVLGEMPSSGLSLWLDSQLLDCAAWKPDGAEFAVQQAPALTKRDEPAATATDLLASIRPNPSAGGATLVVQALKAEKARVALSDAFGRRVFMREVLLCEGQQEIPLPEVAQLPTGVYVWKVYTPSLKTQGHLVKQ